MKLPIHRIYTGTLPASGTIEFDTVSFVSRRVAEIVKDLPNDPILEVDATSRGGYVEVLIFAGEPTVLTAVRAAADSISDELRDLGTPNAVYVKTRTGASPVSGTP